jgi:acetyl-CoA carboxylase biotin carboxyl carrier protein
MADDPASVPDPQRLLRSLCDETHDLVRRVPGGVRRLTLRAGECAVEIEWDPDAVASGAPAPMSVAVSGDGEVAERPDGNVVTAPLVGAFYRSPKPGAPPFVEVGDVVEAGQDVAIIEAMKIMNAIQTEHSGTVAEILVEDTEIVEFGQALMVIVPSGGE